MTTMAMAMSREAFKVGRSLCGRSISTSRLLLAEKYVPSINPEFAVLSPAVQQQKSNFITAKIAVPQTEDLSPITGVPEEHVKGRRVRIYRPAKNCMQSGTDNIQHWEMEFDTRQRWENPLMGWSSSGDPHSNLKLSFNTPDDAVAHCEKHGYKWFIDEGKTAKPERPKNYGVNFSWNRRTRVSTK